MQKTRENRWSDVHRADIQDLREMAVSAHTYASGSDGVWSYIRPLSEILDDIESLVRNGPQGKPLYGMLFSVKDNFHIDGLPLTANSQYPSHFSSYTATAVRAMTNAGAILLGKNTMDEFATGLTGIRSQERPQNPYSIHHVPGGSSSGSAVAVAQGVVAFALATDTGGSGRVPPALNNIIGFKPTPGRYSTHGLLYANKLFDCIPVFSRDKDVTARVMRVMPHAGDGEASKLFGASCRTNIPATRGSSSRIGLMNINDMQFFGDETQRHAYENALSAFLTDTGLSAREVDLSTYIEAGALVFRSPYVSERRMFINSFTDGDTEKLNPSVKTVIEKASMYTAEDVFEVLYKTAYFRASINRIFEEVDFFVTPTIPTIPTIDQVLADPVTENHKLGFYTYAANVLGLPVAAIPYGFREDGLPFGLSIVGRPDSDCDLLDVLRLCRDSGNCYDSIAREYLNP